MADCEAERRARRWAAVSAERDRLLELSRRRTLNREDAEDCVQEALLRSVEFDGLDEDRIGPFLTTVTMRLCADQHRARQRQDRLERRAAGQRVDEAGPEEVVCDQAEAAWLAEALPELPVRQQQVIEARLKGLSDAEIASRLGVSYSSVASALARTRSLVRTMLAAGCAWIVAFVRRPRSVVGVTAVAAAAAVAIGTISPAVRGPAVVPPSVPPRTVELVLSPDESSSVVPRRTPPRARPPAVPPAPPARSEVVRFGPVEGERVKNDRSDVEQVLYCVTHPALGLPGSGDPFLCRTD